MQVWGSHMHWQGIRVMDMFIARFDVSCYLLLLTTPAVAALFPCITPFSYV